MAKIVQKYHKRINAIQSTCVITPCFDYRSGMRVPGCEVESTVWDTGATNTIISPDVIEALNLKPLESARIEGVGGTVDSSVYEINIFLENNMEFRSIKALSGDIGDYDLIIGMDIITMGDFVISNKNQETWFSFRHPSTEHIEF